MRPNTMHNRIVVVGTSGAGKTTLARQLSERLGLPHVELDSLRHGPHWAETPDALFVAQIAEQARRPAWVMDGNYSVAREMLWSAADTVVWLDYSLPRIMGRLVRRTARRLLTREVLWNGNREQLSFLLSSKSILLWALTSHHRRRRQFEALFAEPQHAHRSRLRFRSPAATETWLRSLPPR